MHQASYVNERNRARAYPALLVVVSLDNGIPVSSDLLKVELCMGRKGGQTSSTSSGMSCDLPIGRGRPS